MVHKMRAHEDAVLVGMRTAQLDNPQLSVRDWTGRNPRRIVIDRFLRLSEKLNVFDGAQETLIYNVLKHEESGNVSLVRVDEDDFLAHVVQDLYKKKIQSVIVEGGSQTLQGFISAGLWDEANIFISPQNFQDGIKAPSISGIVESYSKIINDWLKIIKQSK